MIDIDGSYGEGGGQILRTALALSVATGEPVHVREIRSGRTKPGLLRQHLTSVAAAREISGAVVSGEELGSRELVFRPGPVRAGEYDFAVGTAGSACLVAQTILMPLALAEGESRVKIGGGTHNPYAPTFDFLQRVYLPQLSKMGIEVEATLHRAGFYPAGGGRLELRVAGGSKPKGFELVDRGVERRRSATVHVANLPWEIAEREAKVVESSLGWENVRAASVDSTGPGNVVSLLHESENVAEMTVAFGERGVRAERVAKSAVTAMLEYLSSNAPVGSHLADQLMVPMAWAGEGVFRTRALSSHSKTNRDLVARFLGTAIDVVPQANDEVRIEFGSRR